MPVLYSVGASFRRSELRYAISIVCYRLLVNYRRIYWRRLYNPFVYRCLMIDTHEIRRSVEFRLYRAITLYHGYFYLSFCYLWHRLVGNAFFISITFLVGSDAIIIHSRYRALLIVRGIVNLTYSLKAYRIQFAISNLEEISV